MANTNGSTGGHQPTDASKLAPPATTVAPATVAAPKTVAIPSVPVAKAVKDAGREKDAREKGPANAADSQYRTPPTWKRTGAAPEAAPNPSAVLAAPGRAPQPALPSARP